MLNISEEISETNDHATKCKLNVVNLGYYKDSMLHLFAQRLLERNSPEINRGYAIRAIYIRQVITNFIKIHSKNCQVLSLGSGFDTLFWHLQTNDLQPKYGVFEVDFEMVVASKAKIIHKNKIASLSKQNNHYISPLYKLISCDIKQIDTLITILIQNGFDFTIPTIILCECVLVYLEDNFITSVLSELSVKFVIALFVNYDPVNIGDKFGQMMQKNLKEIKYPLLGKKTCNSVTSHNDKYTKNGWSLAKTLTMQHIFHNIFPSNLVQKINSIEFLDELNLLEDLLIHYCVSFGFKGIAEPKIYLYIKFNNL